MFGIPLNWLFAGLLIVGGVAFVYWPWVSAKLKSLAGRVGGAVGVAVDAKPNRKAALDSFDDALAFLESIECKEGVDAMLLALPHFYHQVGHHS